MEVSSHYISQHQPAFNGIFRNRNKNQAAQTESNTPADNAVSSQILTNYAQAGLFSRAKLHLNKMFGNNINNPTIDKINSLEESISKLSNEELKNKTEEFKEILSKRKTSNDKMEDLRLEKEALDEILPEAFAVVRETSRRVLKKRPRDVQMLAGMAIHNSQIAEMMTGEGKTLAATLPAYLNALTGKGVHVITTNDYLAKRDSEQMGKIYKALGLTVGVLTADNSSKSAKKEAYNADITYGTNAEFGFDYLRDNLERNPKDKVQRPYNFAIIDEADSILIDEAITPLVISTEPKNNKNNPSELCKQMETIASQLEEGEDKDYEVDDETNSIVLTEEGMKRAEEMLGIPDLYNTDMRYAYRLIQALKAKEFFFRDEDYIIKNGDVVIVDEFTGRSLEGRKWSNGIHQAVQAKEKLEITGENPPIASITIQSLYKQYPRVSGMTGTASTEKSELKDIYHLEVNEIPTNLELTTPERRKTNRIDYPDRIYKTEEEKDKAIIEEIIKVHNEGRPILIGTTSIESSEHLSDLLNAQGIKHNVLNAKQEEKEAQIIAQAGRYGAVTIATNMAGRGTDIELGGNAEFLTKEELRAKNITPANTPNYEEIEKNTYEGFKKITDAENEKVKALGGLHVIGTEKHEARRIDNQLRGRAARQGDPGSTVFFSSLEDRLIQIMGGLETQKLINSLQTPQNTPIDSKQVRNFVDHCQIKAESRKFQGRKGLNEFDSIINLQRKKIYEQRNEVLAADDISKELSTMIEKEIGRMLERHLPAKAYEYSESELSSFINELHSLIPQLSNIGVEDIKDLAFDEINIKIKNLAIDAFKEKRNSIQDKAVTREIEKTILLYNVDKNWSEYLNEIEYLKEEIGIVAWGGKKPIEEFETESFRILDETMNRIQQETIKTIFSLKEIDAKPKEVCKNKKRPRPAA